MAKKAASTRKPKNDQTTYSGAVRGVVSAPRHEAPPFSPAAGVAALRSWMFAAATINANAVASVPLRLYVREPGASSKGLLWRSRAVDRRRKAHLLGDGRRQPSRTVLHKMADFGTDFVEVTEPHPVTDLLRRVNPWMNGFDLTAWRMLSLQMTGNAYLYVPRTSRTGIPEEYWPMPPQWTRVVPSDTDWIAGYSFGRDPVTAKMFGADEVVHFKMPSLSSLYYGTGYAEMAWAAINLLAANHEYDLSTAKNHARPDYLLTVNGTQATADALDRFEEKVAEKLQGRGKAGQFLAMTGQVDVKPLNFRPKDLAGREDIVEEIGAAFKVPVSMLKANDPNLASASTGFATWRETGVLPLCRMDEEALNQRLMPMFGLQDDAVLAYDDPVPENEEQEWKVRAAKFSMGGVTPNELRIEDGDDPVDAPHMDEPFIGGRPVSQLSQPTLGLGMDALPGDPQAGKPDATARGDTAAIAADSNAAVQDTALNGAQVTALVDLVSQARQGVIPVDTAQAIAAAAFPLIGPDELAAIFGPVRSAKPLPPEDPKPTPEPPVPPKGGTSACSCGSSHGRARIVRATDMLKDGAADAAYLAAEEDRRALALFIKSMERIFGAQTAEVLAIVQANAATPEKIIPAVERAIAANKWNVEISDAVRPVVEDAVLRGAKLAAEGVARAVGMPEPVFEFTNPEVQRYVQTATTRLSSGVNGTTNVRVRTLLQDGLADGETTEELAKRIEELGFQPARAEMIARTESAGAFTHGQIEAWKQTGAVEGKKWLLAPDACEFCRAVAAAFNGKTVPLDQPFYRKGDVLEGDQGGVMVLDYSDIDGPSLHPSCRCSLVPVIKGVT